MRTPSISDCRCTGSSYVYLKKSPCGLRGTSRLAHAHRRGRSGRTSDPLCSIRAACVEGRVRRLLWASAAAACARFVHGFGVEVRRPTGGRPAGTETRCSARDPVRVRQWCTGRCGRAMQRIHRMGRKQCPAGNAKEQGGGRTLRQVLSSSSRVLRSRGRTTPAAHTIVPLADTPQQPRSDPKQYCRGPVRSGPVVPPRQPSAPRGALAFSLRRTMPASIDRLCPRGHSAADQRE